LTTDDTYSILGTGGSVMRWHELYEYLKDQRDNPEFRWNNHVVIHNLETDDEFVCDTWIIKDSGDNDRLVLARLEDDT
tara:strand:- start:1130 stop:1363 length:234 start_codon:yes stop_codon:yes gene_type:complete